MRECRGCRKNSLHCAVFVRMSDRFCFDLEGSRANAWVWRRVGDDGAVVDQSRPFPYYLTAVRDAKAHGFTGTLEADASSLLRRSGKDT